MSFPDKHLIQVVLSGLGVRIPVCQGEFSEKGALMVDQDFTRRT